MKNIIIGGIIGSILAVIFVGKHVSNTMLDATVLIFGFAIGAYVGMKFKGNK